jgi:hypothetical protein
MSALKLLAKDRDDLAIISAALQDSILRVGDFSVSKSSRSLSLRLWRFRNESDKNERILTGLRFDGVMDVKSRGIERSDPEAMVVLLNIDFTADDIPPGGLISLNFAGGGEMHINAEAIEVICADISDPKPTDKVPLHPAVPE